MTEFEKARDDRFEETYYGVETDEVAFNDGADWARKYSIEQNINTNHLLIEEIDSLKAQLAIAVEALEKYTRHETYKGNKVGDYVPCTIAIAALSKISMKPEAVVSVGVKYNYQKNPNLYEAQERWHGNIISHKAKGTLIVWPKEE